MEAINDTNSIHHSILSKQHQKRAQKKVTFADNIDLPLVYILPDNNENVKSSEELVESNNNKYFLPNFKEINEQDAYRRFNSDCICIHSMDFREFGSIRGRIYIKIDNPNLHQINCCCSEKFNKYALEAVYVIWRTYLIILKLDSV